MSIPKDRMALQLRSLVTKAGQLELSLASVPVPAPGPDEVLIRVEALAVESVGPGAVVRRGRHEHGQAASGSAADRPVVTARVPEGGMRAMGGRLDESMPVGNEGAGVVVEAGSSPAAQALLGKTVAAIGGAMYAQYRAVPVAQTLLLPEGATAVDGASSFVNPLTALGMVETMRREGHTALVHTAAASNLGQMLNRICMKDGIALVNIVRKQEQVDLLKGMGAKHVCDSSAPTFLRGPDRRLGRDRRHHRLRRHRRRQARRPDPRLHGSRDQPHGEGIQPLRLQRAQAGLSLRRPRHAPHRVRAQLRHDLGHGRLAALPVPRTRSGRQRRRCSSGAWRRN